MLSRWVKARGILWDEPSVIRRECDSLRWALLRGRQRSERIIGWTGMVVSILVIPSILFRLRDGESDSAIVVASIVGVMGVWYLTVALHARKWIPTLACQLVNTHLELCLPLMVMLSDAENSRTLALLGPASIVLGLSVVVSTLRLRPSLSLYAGAMAAAGQLFVYFRVMGDEDPVLDALDPTMFTSRAAILFLMGITCWVACRGLRGLQETAIAEELERERVRTAFGAYVAEAVVDRVLMGDLTLQTERRDITVIFVDIRGFTTYAERRDPEEVVETLNGALDAFSRAVHDEGGVVNKFLGDGLMALFGAPHVHDDHALRALRAGAAMVEAMDGLSASGHLEGFRIGVGVHSGEVVVGDIGSEVRREYTAIGDVVNVASRLESATKEVGVSLLVSEATRSRIAPGAATLEALDPIMLRGRSGALEIHRLVALPGETGEPSEAEQ